MKGRTLVILLVVLVVALNAFMGFRYGIWTRWDASSWLFHRLFR
jgi:hypothetical protein